MSTTIPSTMKALAYQTAHSLANFQIDLFDVPTPQPGPQDLLVKIKAISVNPVDWKIRSSRSATNPNQPVIIGWDAAGEVVATGQQVQGFKVGDKVYYAGNLNLPGSYAEYQTIDHRLVALAPRSIDFGAAAALPLTSLTAWEGLFEKMRVDQAKQPKVLVWGGAGGVGSIAIQLLKQKSSATVIATASRPETDKWCRDLGADVIVNHRKDIPAQLTAAGFPTVDFIFSTTGSDEAKSIVGNILAPFGHWALIDDLSPFDIMPFKPKSLTVHWELMFTKSMFNFKPETQGQILSAVADLVDKGKIRSTVTKTLQGFTPQNIRQAHTILESNAAIGKTVIVF